MKKTLLILGAMVLLSSSMFGVAVTNPCATGAGIAVTSGVAAATCEIGDKIFSNFTVTGASGTVDWSNTGTQYFVHYSPAGGGVNTTAFTISFDVQVDTTVCAICTITQMQDQMFTSAVTGNSIPNNSTATVTHTPGGVVNLNALSGPAQTGVINLANLLSDHVVFSWAPGVTGGGTTAGELSLAQFTISQTAVPEPMTLSMIGAGLLGLGLMRRRQMGKK